MDINQLKQEARELERQGRYREALAMYRHALTSLEGSPQLLRELPLYVKAGDLYLKLDKIKAGVSLYEQVGKIYAAHGSAKSVGAVCVKVVRAMPERAHVYPRMVRIMLERGHVGPARAVLALWAEHARLKTTHELLDALDDVSDDDMRAVLESVVEMAERLESSPKTSSAAAAEEEATAAETPAAPSEEEERAPEPVPRPDPPSEPPPASTTGAVESEPAETRAPQEPEAPPEPDEPEGVSVAEAETPAREVEEPVVASVASTEQAAPDDAPEDEPVREEPFFIEGTEPPGSPDDEVEVITAEAADEEPVAVHVGEDEMREPKPSPSPRRSSFGSVLVQEPKKRAKMATKGILIGVVAVIIVATLIAVPIVWLGLVPFGRSDNGESGEAPAAGEPRLALPGEAVGDSSADTTLPLTLDPNPQFAAEPVGGGAEGTTRDSSDTATAAVPTPVEATVGGPPAAEPEVEAPVTDSAPAVQVPSVAPALPSEVEPTERQADAVMAIAGLPIRSMSTVTRDGVAGREVVQVIESGEEITVFSTKSASGPTSPTVAIDGETAVGQVRVNGYIVEVRGPVETAIMWQLLDRVAARSVSDN